MNPRYDLAPLEALLTPPWMVPEFDGTTSLVARRCGVDRQRVLRWRKQGMSTVQADFAACRAGYHPSFVWPSWWDDAADEPRCMWCLEPSRRRYCSDRCRNVHLAEGEFLARRSARFWARLDRYRELCRELELAEVA